MPNISQKLGGIGAANIGTAKWNEKMALYKKMKDYGTESQMVNKFMHVKKNNARNKSHDSEESSPSVLRKKILWRNETDLLNQESRGIEIHKKVSNLKAHEVDEQFNYGERSGKNVFDNDYHK